MVAVQVRDQHAVELRERRRQLALPAQVPHAPAQQRVGHDRAARILDQDGGVPDIRDAHGRNPTGAGGYQPGAAWTVSPADSVSRTRASR